MERKYKILTIIILLVIAALAVVFLFPDTLKEIGPWQNNYKIA